MNDRLTEQVLRCPVCGGALHAAGGSLSCERRHCFDVASAGYVNLAGPRQHGNGDSRELVSARTAFLGAGYYAHFAREVCRRVAGYAGGGVIIDAGCGDGYYSLMAAEAAGGTLLGLDLSKHAVTAAARAARRQSSSAGFAVAGIFDMPVRDGVADVVMNLFAPCAAEEFWRVLRPGGHLVVAGAGRDHLAGLRAVIYDTVTPNERRADLPGGGFALLETARVRYSVTLTRRADVQALFAMTPYYYRTSAAGRERLAGLDSLETTVDFDIFVYRKEALT